MNGKRCRFCRLLFPTWGVALSLFILKHCVWLAELTIYNYKSLSPGQWFIYTSNKVSSQISPVSEALLNLHLKSTMSFTFVCLFAFWSRGPLPILTVHLNYGNPRAGPNLFADILLFLYLLFLDCWCFSCQHAHSMNIFLFLKFWKGDRSLLLTLFFFFLCDMWWQVDHVKVNLWSATSKTQNLTASCCRRPW